MADRESFNAALEACGRAGRTEEALGILNSMGMLARSNSRLSPIPKSYASAIQACRSSGDYVNALCLLERMKKAKLRPDQRCILGAVAACSMAGQGDTVSLYCFWLISSYCILFLLIILFVEFRSLRNCPAPLGIGFDECEEQILV